MRKTAAILLCAFFLLSAAGCGNTEQASLSDYAAELPYADGFTVLQLTDIHWNTATQVGNESFGCEEYISKVIREAENHAGHIDLIEITGDTFMLASKDEVLSFIDFMENFELPYAILWGNHDRQGTYNPNWLSAQFLNAEHCIYIEVDNDDVHERSNYVINLKDSEGNTVWQIFNLDSGASYRKGGLDFSLTYDYIREDQLAWLAAEHTEAGDSIPSLVYFHIPQADVNLAWDAYQNGDSSFKEGFFKLENSCPSDYAPVTESLFAENNVRGVFFGHDHANDWAFTSNSGIIYGYGVKTGTELYYGTVPAGYEGAGFDVDESFDLLGASLVTITDTEGSFTLEHLYLNERDEGDFVKWVTY